MTSPSGSTIMASAPAARMRSNALRAWRGARSNRMGAGWLAGVSALLLLSALLSAQFVIWLVPGAAIAWTDGNKRSAIVAAMVVLFTQIFYSFYMSVINGTMPARLPLLP